MKFEREAGGLRILPGIEVKDQRKKRENERSETLILLMFVNWEDYFILFLFNIFVF